MDYTAYVYPKKGGVTCFQLVTTAQGVFRFASEHACCYERIIVTKPDGTLFVLTENGVITQHSEEILNFQCAYAQRTNRA